MPVQNLIRRASLMPVEIGFALIGTGVGLGLRHGVDWDHIAAITDVTSTQPTRARALSMGSLYALGHASVVIALGLLAIWLGAQLPAWIDVYMETLVGITLAGLGIWIFWSMYRSRGQLVLKSRWMVVFDALKSFYRKLPGIRDRLPDSKTRSSAYGPATATGIGMIHGIGAETGSQALLLAAAAGATSALTGSFLLLAFAIGLVVSNTFITFASVSGVIGARGRSWTQIMLGVVIGVFSLVVGVIFIAQQGHLLPGLFA